MKWKKVKVKNCEWILTFDLESGILDLRFENLIRSLREKSSTNWFTSDFILIDLVRFLILNFWWENLHLIFKSFDFDLNKLEGWCLPTLRRGAIKIAPKRGKGPWFSWPHPLGKFQLLFILHLGPLCYILFKTTYFRLILYIHFFHQ